MNEYMSASCRAFRYCLAVIGGIMSAAFISYGIVLRTQDEQSGLEDDFILAFGSFVAIMSCTIGSMASIGDRQVARMVEAMEVEQRRLTLSIANLEGELAELNELNASYGEANTEHRRIIQEAESRYKEQSHELRSQNTSLENTVNRMADGLKSLEEKNRDLQFHVERLTKINAQYTEQLGKLREAQAHATEEVEQLRVLSGEGDARIQQLEALSVEQRARIDELSVQAKNLNELQRKSVRMIQMLSMYGDECKTMGVSLKDVSTDLRKTDHSLGLTTAEMATQLAALKKVTLELRNVALTRGIHEDIDDEEENKRVADT